MSKTFFTSRLGMILSVLGIAVGTGNIWRFPRIAAQNGGEEGAGAFLLVWLFFLLIWSIPLIIAEYAIGRESGKGTIASFFKLGGKGALWKGGFIAVVATAIMFYYSVVAGWCMYYFGITVSSGLPESTEAALSAWNEFQSGYMPMFMHFLAMGLGGLVVMKGITAIERVNKILIPLLLGILMISFVRSVSLPGSWEGIAFLFTPDWSTLHNPRIWLEALTQNAWDTGAGWGLILTYAAYIKKTEPISISAVQTGVGNNVVSMIAAVVIFSTVFGTLGSSLDKKAILELMQNSGPASTGLTFIWIPQLFLKIAGGRIFATIFFLALSFAAFSSLLSMIELATKNFEDLGFSRHKTTIAVVIVGFLCGVPSAVNLAFFANQDFVWGLGLMISGLLIALLVIKRNATDFRERIINSEESQDNLGPWWSLVIKYLIPAQAIILISWWIWRSATEFSEQWYNPFEAYSVMTCLVQWTLGVGVILVFRKKMIARLEQWP